MNASKPLEGTYDIEYNGQIRRSIPAAITEMDLKNLLQSYSDFGYVMVTRTGECSQYNYTIRWQSPGSQPLITIHNISQVLPRGTPVISTSIKNGTINVTSYPLPADSIVTANKDPQVSRIHRELIVSFLNFINMVRYRFWSRECFLFVPTAPI